MTRLRRLSLGALMVLAAVSCESDTLPITQVMVVVDSDLAQLTNVRVVVMGMGDPKEAIASDLTNHPLPRTVAVVHRGGPLGPITIVAEARAGTSVLVSRRAEISFVSGHNLTLPLMLENSCVGVKCTDEDDTCIAGSCEPMEIDSDELKDWDPKEDAGAAGGKAGQSGGGGRGGTGGGGQGGSGGQGGRGGSGGTGGVNAGSGGSPPNPCDSCMFASDTTEPHGALACENSTCKLTCDSGWADADKQSGNGCEMSTTGFTWTVQNIDPAQSELMSATVQTLTIDCSATLDLGSGALPAMVDICGDAVKPVLMTQRNGGPEVVAFGTRHLTVTSGSKFRFTGARPIVIVVYGDADVDGELDASAVATMGGTGSDTECSPGIGGSGASDTSLTMDAAGGGGGGGFGTSGGDGAKSTSTFAGQPGVGGPVSSVATLAPLRGGCAGGAGGKGSGSVSLGGGGGGALQLSVSGTLRVNGTIAAAGGGGAAGFGEGDGGGGGGSGGAILLEAAHLQTAVSSWLTANGGGGGEGHPGLASNREVGADGSHNSATPAPGGTGKGQGGNGSAGSTAATAAPPPDCVNANCGGGGGGGGVGRIVLRSLDCQIAGSASPATSCAAP